MNSLPGSIPTAPASTIGYHGAVSDFKRRLIEATLHQARGNPHARGARARAAADVLAAAHPRSRRRGAAAAAATEALGRVEVDLWRPARQSVGRHA
jgi:hypothetical protein